MWWFYNRKCVEPLRLSSIFLWTFASYRLDIDECAAPPNPCQPGHTCLNTPGSYHCRRNTITCRRGYHLDANATRCQGARLLHPPCTRCLFSAGGNLSDDTLVSLCRSSPRCRRVPGGYLSGPRLRQHGGHVPLQLQ